MTPKQLSLPLPRFEICVYCGSAATTRDHVPPKGLLDQPWPPNLRTVPACSSCNSSWSLDEQYFAIALAHIGHTASLMSKVEADGPVDRALQAAPLLDDMIIRGLGAGPDGRVWFTPDLDRIRRVATKIAYGLYCLRYGVAKPIEALSCNFVAGPGVELPLSIVAVTYFRPGIRRKRWTIVQADVFSFLFAKGWLADDPPVYCLLDFHHTLIAAVLCPAPIGQRKHCRLRAKPW
jgi:hypothetical protein